MAQQLPPDAAAHDGRDAPQDACLRGLIERGCRGDAQAFASLYDATARMMLWQVRKVVQDGQAEDVLAEVYLQVWRSLADYRPERGSPTAWLCTIARSRALDHLRREKARESTHARGAALAPDGTVARPDELLALAQHRHVLHASLAGSLLTSDERLVIGLAYFGEHSQDEIVRATGFTAGRVRSLGTRALQKLRAQLERARHAPGSQQAGP